MNRFSKAMLALAFTGAALVGVAGAENGVTDNSVLLGQSCALNGPAEALGTGMQTGLTVAFGVANANGGVDGRTIELKSMNDSYEPDRCEKAVTALIEKAKVFMMIGGVGTPTAKAAVPVCEANEVPFVAPFTGAEFLRNPFKKYVVNLRASYNQEMEALAAYLVDEQGLKNIACFYQNDGYGQAGLAGITKALESRGMSLAGTGTYERNTVAVGQGLSDVAGTNPDAIIMVGAYKPCAEFIKQAKSNDATKSAVFCNISFVGTKALTSELGSLGEGVIISQVVPFPWDTSIPVVKEFHNEMNKAGKSDQIGFVTLEGYLAGKFFVNALDNVEGTPSREAFLASVQNTGTFDLGGFVLEFGPDDHQGSDNVFLTWVNDGKLAPLGNTSIAGVPIE
ncbi:unnamed protein product [Symbiodinium necroappetens]|uniref:Leucine-binding protein domain-containing protein n=1 Tax=Symbiodinium necroappetens TaxID=1628268 RepID=A0A812RB30_9DINO|nr:unnamed protein product [Symbiodinium necroappetens]